jgi:hypothetical protein
VLYDYIVASYFRTGPPENESDSREWRYSPEQCGLRVIFLYGRWFATWTWPEEDTDMVRLDLGRHGGVMQYDVTDEELRAEIFDYRAAPDRRESDSEKRAQPGA